MIAHDVDMIWNKPRCPQLNAKVERMQGTSSRWVDVPSCESIQELQNRLNHEAYVQREKYPVKRLGNKTRLEVFPNLETSRRQFISQDCDVQRVYSFLAQKTYIRTSDKAGCLMIYQENFNLSVANARKKVAIKWNAHDQEWIFYIDDAIVASKKSENLKPDRIVNLTVCQ